MTCLKFCTCIFRNLTARLLVKQQGSYIQRLGEKVWSVFRHEVNQMGMGMCRTLCKYVSYICYKCNWSLYANMYAWTGIFTGAWSSFHTITDCNKMEHDKIWTKMGSSMQETETIQNPSMFHNYLEEWVGLMNCTSYIAGSLIKSTPKLAGIHRNLDY